MPDKDIEDVKKQVANEIKLLCKKTEKECKEAEALRKEAAELAARKDLSSDDKKRTVDLRKALQTLEKSYLTQAESTSDRINRLLKTNVPDDKKALPEWQKGMDKWYRDMVEKEAGLGIGKDLKVTGDISIKNKEATIILKGKF